MDELKRDWEIYKLALEEFRDLDDDRGLAIGSWHARGRRSGVELRLQEAAWLAQYRNGKLSRMQTFIDRDTALEAVGLREAAARLRTPPPLIGHATDAMCGAGGNPLRRGAEVSQVELSRPRRGAWARTCSGQTAPASPHCYQVFIQSAR